MGIVNVSFPAGSRMLTVYGLTQYDYGQVLNVGGLSLPAAIECQISYQAAGGSAERLVGTVRDGILTLELPDLYLAKDTAASYAVYIFIYLTTEESGTTVYKIVLPVMARPMPEGYEPGETDPFATPIDTMREILGEAEDAATLSKSWAVGGTGTRENEDTDNASYYCGLAAASKRNAADSERNAASSEHNALESEQKALASERNAASSEHNALESEQKALASERNAGDSAASALASKTNAAASALVSEGFSVGRQNGQEVGDSSPYYENNAKYYKEQASAALTSVNNAKDTALGDIRDAKTAALGDIGDAKTSAVGDVNAAKETVVEAVGNKGAEVLDSIPQDYSVLNSNVDTLTDYMALLADEVPNTTQEYTFSGGSVSQVTHSSGGAAVRTDLFTYAASSITEVRTLASGASLTIVTNLITLETAVTYAAA